MLALYNNGINYSKIKKLKRKMLIKPNHDLMYGSFLVSHSLRDLSRHRGQISKILLQYSLLCLGKGFLNFHK